MGLIAETYKDIRGYRHQETWKFYPATGAVLDLLYPPKMEWIDQAYLDEGTRCHADMKSACDWFIANGEWPTSSNHRVRALIKCLQDHELKPLEAEVTRCSDVYGHAGTPDAFLGDGYATVLPDWKFAESLDERYQDQIQSYQAFFPSAIPRLMLFRVDRDGNVFPRKVQRNQKQWTLFLNALACLKFRLR